jgi:hypothetical protein
MDTNKDKQPAASVATSNITSMKGQKDYQKTGLTDGPTFCPEDLQPLPSSLEEELVSSSERAANEKLKQYGTAKKRSASNSEKASKRETHSPTRQDDRRDRIVSRQQEQNIQDEPDEDGVTRPGAIRISPMTSNNSTDAQGQKDYQKKGLTDGPTYCPEDLQPLPSRLEEELGSSSERATNEKLKQYGTAEKTITSDSEKASKRETHSSTRQDDRRDRIVSRQQEQNNRDEPDEDGVTRPGAIRISPMTSNNSAGVQEGNPDEEDDPLTMAEEGLTNHTVLLGETNNQRSISILLEAQLVNGEATEELMVDQRVRKQIQQEMGQVSKKVREEIEQEMGRVAQAEVVEDNGSKTLGRRALLGTGIIMVILSGVIIGIVIGTRDTSSSSAISPAPLTTATMFPDIAAEVVANSCENAFGPIIPSAVGSFLFGSTEDGGNTVDTEVPSCGSASSQTAPGIWFTIIGDGGAITASTCNTSLSFPSQLSVFTGSCDQLTCVDGNSDACGSQSLVTMQSNQNQTYHVLVHGSDTASGNFALTVMAELCDSQMLEPDGVSRDSIFLDARAEKDLPALPLCFSWSENLPPYGLWYRIVGTDNLMSVQLDSEVLDLNGTRISVLSSSGGTGCSNLSCVAMDCINTCDWESTVEQIYFIYVVSIQLVAVSMQALDISFEAGRTFLVTAS